MKRYLIIIYSLLFAWPAVSQTVKITGTVINSKESAITFIRNDEAAVTGVFSEKRYKVKLGDAGKFDIILPVDEISKWLVEVGSDRFDVFVLIPNENVSIVIDAIETGLMMNTIAKGPHAANFNYFSYYLKKSREKNPIETYAVRTDTLDILEYLKFQKEISQYDLKMLDEYRKSFKLTDEYYNWLKTAYQYSPYNEAINRARAKKKIKDPEIFKLLTAQLSDDNYAAKNSVDYNNLLEYYMHYKFNNLSYPIDMEKFFDFVSNTNFSATTKSVTLTRRMMDFRGLKNDSLYNSIFQQFKERVNDAELLKIVTDSRKGHLNQISNAVKENISKAKGLNEILQKYEGKVIYLDFWASWCAPCKEEMPNAAKLRAKLKGKDVVFVYFGYKDTKKKWLATQKELKIEGEHYLLSAELIDEANDLFEIIGVPRYVIIGKDGTIISRNANGPSQVYEQLIKLAEK
ncbi:redoxin family protein [Pedobacter sp. LMG 31464]|uniref:Redoxin family protein n=1 Tax=Pedobacter planticolens TaxID=2679964 RepID=A0A923E2X2_9SPHI|nr:TlpA disulfide reductase family protein [Pedobacter planticolens]MBB2147063.1 redoxin family protein [Pedobacter planticolens]